MILKPLYLIAFVILMLGCKETSHHTKEISGKRIPIDTSIPANASIEDYIKPFSEHINKTLDSVLAYNPSNLSKSDGELNTALGNLMADVVMEQANPVIKKLHGREIDVVLLNQGGIRSSVDQGFVSARTAYSLMPFENEIVVAEITGTKIMEMLTYLVGNKTAHPISGISIKLDQNYQLVSATIAEKEIDPAATYFVATSDYLQQGGDNMNFFKDPVALYRIDYKIRNALIDYFARVDTLKTKRDNRYIKIE